MTILMRHIFFFQKGKHQRYPNIFRKENLDFVQIFRRYPNLSFLFLYPFTAVPKRTKFTKKVAHPSLMMYNYPVKIRANAHDLEE